MRLSNAIRWRRVPLVVMALLSFFVASNHCVVVGLASENSALPASCHSVPDTQAASCCHGDQEAPRPAPPGPMPCCIVTAPPSTPSAWLSDAPLSSIDFERPDADQLLAPADPTWVGRIEREHGPPHSPSPLAPLAPRAPPLA